MFGFSYIFESAEPVLKETKKKKNGFKVIKKHFKLLSNGMKWVTTVDTKKHRRRTEHA